MIDFDDFDDIFARIQDMMNNQYSGGYHKSRKSNTRDDPIDIQEDDKHIYITLELKVRDEDLTVTPKEDSVIIEVMIDGTWNKRTITLSAPINPKTAKISFNNCVLDIQLTKTKEKKDEEINF